MPSEKPPSQGAFDFGRTPKRAEPEPHREPDRAPPIPPAPTTPMVTTPSMPLVTGPTTPPLLTTPPGTGESSESPRRDEPRVFTVSDLVRAVARTVEARFGLVWVE